MIKSIKTSEANRVIVTDLTNKLGMGPENVIARIAFAYSISLGRKLDPFQMDDSKGKEYSSRVLFGDYQELYLAVICQRYEINTMDFDIPRYIKMHIDDGLELISRAITSNPNLPVFDFIIDLVDSGLLALVNGHTNDSFGAT
ncbi:DndE family protein [Chloroflexota bacterium]